MENMPKICKNLTLGLLIFKLFKQQTMLSSEDTTICKENQFLLYWPKKCLWDSNVLLIYSHAQESYFNILTEHIKKTFTKINTIVI